MHDWSSRTRWLVGAWHAVGLGLLAGSLEMLGLAASLRLSLGFGGFVILGALELGMLGVLGGLAGAIAGLVHLRPVDPLQRSRPMAVQLGLAGLLLCGWYLWAGAATLLADGRTVAAATMALMPLAFGGVIYFNAGFWYRKAELGAQPRLGWVAIASAGAVAVVLLAGSGHALRDTGGTAALDGDANVLLITVDGLARDGVYGGPLQAHTEGAVVFEQAVSPLPASLPAAVTVHTSLHPLRHGVLDDHSALRPGFWTLAERLEREGWATGAFVYSGALNVDSGLAQGFRTYDDTMVPRLPGLSKLSVPRRLGVGGVGAVRGNAQTVDRFASWYEAHQGVPFFAWVHLQDDGALGEQLVRIEGALADAGLAGTTLVVYSGTYGRREGPGALGLGDPLVTVPLWVKAPGLSARSLQIDAQVRLMDIAPTVLDYLRLDPLEPSEGLDLLGYAEGVRKQPLSTSLVGRGGDDLFDTVLLGLRNNGLKYVREVRTGKEWLYDLDSDAGEQHDLSESQAATLERARGLVMPEEAALRRLLREGP